MFEENSAEISPKPGPQGARVGAGGARPGAGRKPRPKPVIAALPDIARWHCVRTGRDAERRAAIEIGLGGFDVFSPTIWRPGRPGRRYTNGIVTPARPARLAPLFPRYVFCSFSRAAPSWKRIWGMFGVDALLGLPEAPIAVPDAAIELIKAMCSENGCIYPSTHAGPLPVGITARLLNGPLAGLAGIIEMSDGRRVQLLLQLLGQIVPVKVRQAAVEVAAA